MAPFHRPRLRGTSRVAKTQAVTDRIPDSQREEQKTKIETNLKLETEDTKPAFGRRCCGRPAYLLSGKQDVHPLSIKPTRAEETKNSSERTQTKPNQTEPNRTEPNQTKHPKKQTYRKLKLHLLLQKHVRVCCCRLPYSRRSPAGNHQGRRSTARLFALASPPSQPASPGREQNKTTAERKTQINRKRARGSWEESTPHPHAGTRLNPKTPAGRPAGRTKAEKKKKPGGASQAPSPRWRYTT